MSYPKYEKRVLAKNFRKEMTEAENIFWQHVRDNRLDRLPFRRQVVIEGFIADFYCRQLCLVIEINGGIHETTQAYDKERTEILGRQGITVLTFSNEEVLGNISDVLNAIRDYAKQR